MKFSTEKQGDVAILSAGGRLDAGGAPEFDAQGKTLLQGGAKRLLIDLAGVDYISSAGLRSLLVLAKATKASGSALALCCLTPAVKEVMTISGFDNILALAADRSAAMDLLK
jgi:anti-anti-sigma factor